TLAEMTMPHPRYAGGELGIRVDLSETGKGLQFHQKAFSETGGFVVEVPPAYVERFRSICESYGVNPFELGEVVKEPIFEVRDEKDLKITQPLNKMQEVYLNSLAGYLK